MKKKNPQERPRAARGEVSHQAGRRKSGKREEKPGIPAKLENEERLRLIALSTPDHVLVQDEELRYLWVLNPQLGLKEEEMIGRTDFDILSREDAERITLIKRRVLETGNPEYVNTPLVSSCGDIQYFDGSYIPKRNPQGRVDGILGYFRNVTAQMNTVEALRRSEEQYRSLFEKMTEGFALHEIICTEQGVPSDYRFLEINPAFERLTGLTREIIGKRMKEVLPGDDPKWIEIYGKVALTGAPVRFENYSPVLRRHFEVFAYSPAPRQFAVLFNDISERKKKETELFKLNRILKAVNDFNQVMIRVNDEAEYLKEICRIIVEDCGHAMVWVGYAEEDDNRSVRPMAYSGFEQGYLETLKLTWADSERGQGPTGTAIRSGKACICRNILTDPQFKPWREDAFKRGYSSSIALPLSSSGKIFGAINIYSRESDPFSEDEVKLLSELAGNLAYGIEAMRFREEHARAVEALKVSLTKYWVLFDSFPLGVSISDKSGALRESNREAERLLGLSKEEHEKRRIGGGEWRIIRQDGTPMPEEEYASVRALKENRLVENVEMGIVQDDDITWLNVTAAPIPLEGYGVAITYGDITRRKEMEDALRETRDYLESLIDYANAPIIVWDPSFRIIRFNHAFERLTGLEAAQVLGKPLDILFPARSRDESMNLIRDALSGERWEIVEIPILQKEGSIRTVLWNSANIHDKRGVVIATIAQGQDITDRKIAEEKIQASLKEKEMLLRELHHRTKNNMQVISSLIALQISSVKDSTITSMFNDMQNRIRTMSLVHEKLYQSSDLSNLNIRDYICDLTRAILDGSRSQRLKIELKLDIESIPISIETAIPCGLIVNELMSNSLKYAFPDHESGEIGILLHLRSGNRLALEYYDTGIGFPEGFDTRNTSTLGLKLVNNLAKKQLRGDVEFHNKKGVHVLIQFCKINM